MHQLPVRQPVARPPWHRRGPTGQQVRLTETVFEQNQVETVGD